MKKHKLTIEIRNYHKLSILAALSKTSRTKFIDALIDMEFSNRNLLEQGTELEIVSRKSK
jgi:hypothetical protein